MIWCTELLANFADRVLQKGSDLRFTDQVYQTYVVRSRVQLMSIRFVAHRTAITRDTGQNSAAVYLSNR